MRVPLSNFNPVTQGSTKVPSGRPEQVDFEVGQVTFQGHLPDGQALGQTLRQIAFYVCQISDK